MTTAYLRWKRRRAIRQFAGWFFVGVGLGYVGWGMAFVLTFMLSWCGVIESETGLAVMRWLLPISW